MRTIIVKLIYIVVILTVTAISIYNLELGTFIALLIGLNMYLERFYFKNFYLGKYNLRKLKDKTALKYFLEFLKDLDKNNDYNSIKYLQLDMYSFNLRAKTYNNIGLCYLESKVYKKAQDYFNNAIKEDEKFCMPYYNLAIINMIKNKDDIAREYLNKSIKLGYNKIKFERLKSYVDFKYNALK